MVMILAAVAVCNSNTDRPCKMHFPFLSSSNNWACTRMLTLLLINTFPDPIPNDFLKDKKYTDAKVIVTEMNIFQIIHTELM
jgi:hypothetical protein